MEDHKRRYRVCIVTSTRADWGLLMPLVRELRYMPEVDLSIAATNMHLLPEFGMTVNEITGAGFSVDERVPMDVAGSDEASRVKAMSRCLDGFADAFQRLHPDAVVILGDRYEMLAVASAAALMHIPIIHIAGGEISEGAVDDSIRHAITKLATFHLTSTEPYRQRVIQLGEDPDRVVNTGAIGVWNTMNIPLIPRKELESDLGFDLSSGPVAVVTYHPATNETATTATMQIEELLAALDDFPQLRYVITYPNNDAHGEEIISHLRQYASLHADRVLLVRSLGMSRYLSMLRVASVVIGNSSSGIVEVPSAGIPTVDIGIRQRGRIAAQSVIHCDTSHAEITRAIRHALSPEMQSLATKCGNPYYRPDTLAIMTRSILSFLHTLPCPPKRFHDLK